MQRIVIVTQEESRRELTGETKGSEGEEVVDGD